MSAAMRLQAARLWTSHAATGRATATTSMGSQMRFASHLVDSQRLADATARTHGKILGSTRTLFTQRKPRPVRTTLKWTLLAFGLTFGVAYHLDSRSAIHRWIAIPVLQTLTEPETAQKLAIKLLSLGIMPRDFGADDEVLATEVAGLSLSNPIGLAAGFDKQAEAIDGLLNLGFGIVEVGSVTPKPQPGNDLPRYFRLPSDHAAINRFGFNSDGHETVVNRLRERIQSWLLGSSSLAKSRIPLPDSESASHRLLENATIDTILASDHVPKSLRPGQLLAVNLGKNKSSAADSVDDYVQGVAALGPYADLLVINISSPNTPGLRSLQRKDILASLMSEVISARDQLPLRRQSKVPIFVKIAPDLQRQELIDISDAAVSAGVEGLIVSNTTVQRPDSLLSPPELTSQTGGLSGAPLKPLSLDALQTVRQRVGKSMSIIGCGGIFSGQDALDFAKAGANAVELYTSFGYEGVGHPRRVKDELTALLKAQGTTWKAVVGTGLDQTASSTLMQLPHNEKETNIVGGLQDRFGESMASVKSEIEELRRTLGMAVGKADRIITMDDRVEVPEIARPASQMGFRPDPNDKEYTSLLDKVHDVLGVHLKDATAKTGGHVETGMSQTEAQRARIAIALQDPSVAPSMALQGAGQTATVGQSEAPTSGRNGLQSLNLSMADVRFASANARRSDEGRIGMGGKSDFNAADKKRVV